MRLELSEREKSFVRFLGFILFILFESWIRFDDFIIQTLRAIIISIRSMGLNAIPHLVSYNYNGLEWAVLYSPLDTPSISLINIGLTGLMFYAQYHIFLRIIVFIRKM